MPGMWNGSPTASGRLAGIAGGSGFRAVWPGLPAAPGFGPSGRDCRWLRVSGQLAGIAGGSGFRADQERNSSIARSAT